MSEETKTIRSSETPEADTSASGSRPASGRSSAVANVRTLQDVQREIDAEQVKFDEADKEYQQGLSLYTAAFLALKKEPNNETLSKELADATKFMDFIKGPFHATAKLLEGLSAERFRLQAAAIAASEQKSKC